MDNSNNNHIGKNTHRNENRKRKMIWFNPPYCRLGNISIGKYFLNLIDKHFTKNNPLSKIFNRNIIRN